MEGSGPFGIVTPDDIAGELMLSLAPVAGGQLSTIADQINDSLNWLGLSFLSDAVTVVTNALTSVGLTVWKVLTAALGWILKWAYSFLRGQLLPLVAVRERFRFPAAATIFGTDPLWLVSLVGNLLIYALMGAVELSFYWLRDRVVEVLGYAARGFTDLASMVEARVGDWTWYVLYWVRQGLGYAARGFTDLASMVEQRLSDWSWYVLYWVLQGLGHAAYGFGSIAKFVEANVWGVARWLLTQVQAAIGAIPGLPGTLLTSITSAVNAAATWVRDQVLAGLGLAVNLAGNVVSPLTTVVNAAVSWLWVRVQAAIGAIPGLPGNLLSLIGGQVTAAATWLWNNIQPKLDQLVNTLVGGAAGILTGLLDILKDALNAVFGVLFDPVLGLIQAKMAIPGKMLTGQYPSFNDFLADLMDPPDSALRGVWAWPVLTVMGVISTLISFMPALQPVNQKWLQESQMFIRGALPTIRDMNEMVWRGKIDRDTMSNVLDRLGYPDEFGGGYLNMVDLIPNRADLVEMVVKEAFNPAAIAAFGLAGELPGEFVTWMAKQGYTEDWARKYWIAHWRLPSVEQVFEMLHRGVVDQATTNLYLKTADYSPPWRDRLTAISYNPLTRVDVRRMFAAGVIGRDKVLQVYRALGYSPEDAEFLTTWVAHTYGPDADPKKKKARDLSEGAIKQAYARRLITRDDALERLRELPYSEDEADFVLSIWDFDFFTDPSWRSDLNPKELSRTLIEQAYERGLSDANRAAAQLEDIGYTPEDAALIIHLVDLKNHQDTADLEAQVIVERYKAGVLSAAAMAAALRDIHVPEARIELIVVKETLRRQVKTARLTRADLQKAVKKGLITPDNHAERLDAMGYNAADVDIIMALGAPA